MIEKLAKTLAVWLTRVLNETNKKTDILCYGFQIVLNTIFSITLVVLLGSIIGKPLHTLFYLFSYCSIRIWAGGYHAKSNGKCIFLFVTFFIVSIIFADIIILNKTALIIILCVENIILFLVAPIGSNENPIPEALIKGMKCKTIFSSLLISILIILQNDMKMKAYGFYGLSWTIVLVLCGKVCEERIR